jgi:hypothetical protein
MLNSQGGKSMSQPESFDPDEIKSMMELAAKSMAGHKIRVNILAPLREGYRGEAFKDEDGTPAMNLLPVEDLEELYKTFLHELNHVLFDVEDQEPRVLPAEIMAAQERGAFIYPALSDSEHAEYFSDPKECQARSFADYLYTFTKDKARFFYNDDSVKACLRVLQNTTIKEHKE